MDLVHKYLYYSTGYYKAIIKHSNRCYMRFFKDASFKNVLCYNAVTFLQYLPNIIMSFKLRIKERHGIGTYLKRQVLRKKLENSNILITVVLKEFVKCCRS